MKKKFIRQIAVSFLYYLIGFFITWIVYTLSGSTYAHGPSLFHLVGFVVLLGGLAWLLKAIASLFTKDKQLGTLLVHTLVLGGIVVSFVLGISKESDIDISNPERVITINKDTATNTTSIVNGNGDTLYFKRGDSVLIDKVGRDTSKLK